MIASGIYQIVNTANGKRYIGSAKNFRTRWRRHQWELKNGIHPNRFLQASWFKYGATNFEFRPLIRCASEHLLMFEQRCLDGFVPEFNLSPTAGSLLGFKHSVEELEKMAAAQRGRTHSVSSRAKMSAARIGNKNCVGRILSQETRRKIGDAQRGKQFPPERVAAMYGRKVSLETRAKLSAMRRGKKKSSEHAAKLSANLQKYWRERKAIERRVYGPTNLP